MFYYGNARSNNKTRIDKFGGRFTASVTLHTQLNSVRTPCHAQRIFKLIFRIISTMRICISVVALFTTVYARDLACSGDVRDRNVHLLTTVGFLPSFLNQPHIVE